MLGLIFAAPFLLAAALLFTTLSLIPSLRRFSVTVPTGIIASGPGSIAGLSTTGFAYRWIGSSPHPASSGAVDLSIDILSFAVGGILLAIVAALVMRRILTVTPLWLIRLVVFSGALCSYFVLLLAASAYSAILVPHLQIHREWLGSPLEFACLLLLSVAGAIVMSAHPERFRLVRQ